MHGRTGLGEEVSVDLLQRQAMKDNQQGADEINVNADVRPDDGQSRRGGRRYGGNYRRRDDDREKEHHHRDRNDRDFQKGNYNPENSTLVVVGVPHNLNSIGKLDEHFSKFGPVVNIEVIQREKKAYIKFSSHNDANKAFRSSEVWLFNFSIFTLLTRPSLETGSLKSSGPILKEQRPPLLPMRLTRATQPTPPVQLHPTWKLLLSPLQKK
jgi:hypothetical protein